MRKKRFHCSLFRIHPKYPFLLASRLVSCSIWEFFFEIESPIICHFYPQKLSSKVSGNENGSGLIVFSKDTLGTARFKAPPSPLLAFALARIFHCWQMATTNCWMSTPLRSDMATKATGSTHGLRRLKKKKKKNHVWPPEPTHNGSCWTPSGKFGFSKHAMVFAYKWLPYITPAPIISNQPQHQVTDMRVRVRKYRQDWISGLSTLILDLLHFLKEKHVWASQKGALYQLLPFASLTANPLRPK